MKPIAKVILGIVAFSAVVGVATWLWIASRYAQAFEATKIGEPFAMVISRFGAPSVREVPAHPFLIYAVAGCQAPCSVRLWWEHPVLKGIEAWSVDFDNKNQVIHKSHWVSP
jgi:hypothetical protein